MRQSKPKRRNIHIGKNTYRYSVGRMYIQLWHPSGEKELILKNNFPMSEVFGRCSCGSYGCEYNTEVRHAVRPSDVRKYIESQIR